MTTRTTRVQKYVDARGRAQRLVMAWLDTDFEPDQDDTASISEASFEKLIDRIAAVFDGQLRHVPGPDGKQKSYRLEIGTPRPITAITDAYIRARDLRAPECPAYNLCLAYAVREAWPGFSCAGCRGPGSATSKVDRKNAEVSEVLCALPGCGRTVTAKQLRLWNIKKRQRPGTKGPYCSDDCYLDSRRRPLNEDLDG